MRAGSIFFVFGPMNNISDCVRLQSCNPNPNPNPKLIVQCLLDSLAGC